MLAGDQGRLRHPRLGRASPVARPSAMLMADYGQTAVPHSGSTHSGYTKHKARPTRPGLVLGGQLSLQFQRQALQHLNLGERLLQCQADHLAQAFGLLLINDAVFQNALNF